MLDAPGRSGAAVRMERSGARLKPGEVFAHRLPSGLPSSPPGARCRGWRGSRGADKPLSRGISGVDGDDFPAPTTHQKHSVQVLRQHLQKLHVCAAVKEECQAGARGQPCTQGAAGLHVMRLGPRLSPSQQAATPTMSRTSRAMQHKGLPLPMATAHPPGTQAAAIDTVGLRQRQELWERPGSSTRAVQELRPHRGPSPGPHPAERRWAPAPGQQEGYSFHPLSGCGAAPACSAGPAWRPGTFSRSLH